MRSKSPSSVGTPRSGGGRVLPTRKSTRWALLIILLIVTSPILVPTFIKAAWMARFSVDGRAMLKNKERADLMNRRAYLIRRLYLEGAGPNAMPWIIPAQFQGEWALVSHSMTAASLANIARLYPETRKESRSITRTLIRRVLRKEFRAFDRRRWGRDPLYGGSANGHIGYLGHLDFMLAAYYSLGGRDGRLMKLFDRISIRLAKNLRRAPHYNARTYPGETYIPDNAVVVAALALHGRMRGNKYTADTARLWIQYAGRRLRDKSTGVLAFRPGRTAESRSSGAGWTTFYLFYADEGFARAQFKLMKKHFLETGLPFTGMREFADGSILDAGDLDSGPLVLGLSPAGTGFSIAGARFTGDAPLLDSLLFSAEFAGFSIQWAGERCYLFAPLVGDASLLAMRSVTNWH